tara:strand:- start:183 stop:455 length:273 start_codon:yes stop_codon:yes gene_type:complete
MPKANQILSVIATIWPQVLAVIQPFHGSADIGTQGDRRQIQFIKTCLKLQLNIVSFIKEAALLFLKIVYLITNNHVIESRQKGLHETHSS